VAVKVTEVPAHIVLPGLADILSDGVTLLFTVMLMLLLVAAVGLAQLALLVRMQVMVCPLVKVEEV
jgi:hypothetical protein